MSKRIYVIGFPSSSLLLVEALIRYASDFGIDYGEQFYMDAYNRSQRGGLRVSMSPQLPCVNLAEVKKSLSRTGPMVVQAICPSQDAEITDLYDLLEKETCIYVSAVDPNFTIVNSVTDRNAREIFSPTKDIKRWNVQAQGFDDLVQWQKREYLSQYIDYFYDKTVWQKSFLEDRDVPCFDAYNLFVDTRAVAEQIFATLGLNIINQQAFDYLVTEWNTNNDTLLKDYDKVSNFIKAIDEDNEDSTLNFSLRSVVYEAIIQRHLRIKEVDLVCYGLDDFPTRVLELKEYYDEFFD